LAERSRAAADLINKVSKNGVEVASEAGSQFEAVVPEIERTANLIREISASSMEQTAGIDQINQSIIQLDHTSQMNATISEEVATTAEELSKQALELKRIVSFFTLEKNQHTFELRNKSDLQLSSFEPTINKQFQGRNADEEFFERF
jgi:methyl-accepting chemotaxis protein